MLRVGIYGGAFAPIHIGHVAAAKAFMEQMWLDVLFIIPTGNSPHKEMSGGADNRDRLEMCKKAFENIEVERLVLNLDLVTIIDNAFINCIEPTYYY